MVNFDYLYNKDFYGDKLYTNCLYDKKLHFKIIQNGTVLPYKPPISTPWGFGGIIDAKRNFIEGSFSNNEGCGAYTPTEEVKFVPASVIYLGMFVGVWGHVISENLKHAWFLNSEIYKKAFKNLPIIYNPWMGGGGINKNLIKLLKILEVDTDKLIPITAPTKFQNIIFPDESFFLIPDKGRFFTEEYVETIDRIRNFAKKNFTELSQKKIFFFHGKGEIGEERLAEYFKSKGYSVLRPETFPLEEQLNIMANCTDFASTLGSCAHNMIFMQDNSNVIIIPRYFASNGYQLVFNQIHEMNIDYIDSTFSIFNKDVYGPYCYIISKQLKKFFGDEAADEYTEEDFITFLKYIKNSLSQGLQENPELRKYYSAVLPEFFNELKKREDLTKQFGIAIQ